MALFKNPNYNLHAQMNSGVPRWRGVECSADFIASALQHTLWEGHEPLASLGSQQVPGVGANCLHQIHLSPHTAS